MGGFSIWHWLIVLALVVLIFGTKKLRSLGSDIGEAIKNFKNALGENKTPEDKPPVDEKKDIDKTSDK